MILMNKHKLKGMAINEMSGVVLAFVVVAIIVGIGGTTLTSVQATQTANTAAYNATTKGLTGVTTFGDWLPTIAVISAAAVVIGLIYMYFR